MWALYTPFYWWVLGRQHQRRARRSPTVLASRYQIATQRRTHAQRIYEVCGVMITFHWGSESGAPERSSSSLSSHRVGWGGRGGRERGRLAVSGEPEVEEKEGEAGPLGVTFWKYTVIFVWLSCLSSSLKNVSVWPNPSTVCFRVSALVIKGCLSSKKSKAILHSQTPSAGLAHVGLFSVAAASRSFSWPGTGAEAPISSGPSPGHSSGVLPVSSWVSPRFVSWHPSASAGFAVTHSPFHESLDRLLS